MDDERNALARWEWEGGGLAVAPGRRIPLGRAVHPTFPLARGTATLGAGLLAGLAAVTLAGALPRRWRAFARLAGAVALLGTGHGLTHLLVGRVWGKRFTR